jgi:3-oxoacyl-[acyl-carrier protein] reductase
LARNADALDRVRAAIENRNGSAFPVVCDLTSRESVDCAIDAVHKKGGAPLVLVNNAGVGGPFHRTSDVSDDEWEGLFATNLRSAFWLTRAFLPAMKNAGFGRIVNIASVYGQIGGPGSTTYTATKHALVGYTRAIAVEWARYGITCNAVCPGFIQTDMRADFQLGRIPNFSVGPSGRKGQPAEVAALVLYLIGETASYVNGASIVIDGGLTAGVGLADPGSSQ